MGHGVPTQLTTEIRVSSILAGCPLRVLTCLLQGAAAAFFAQSTEVKMYENHALVV